MPSPSFALAAATQTVPAGAVIHWGLVTITLANLVVILSMIAVFVLAIVLPFPGSRKDDRT